MVQESQNLSNSVFSKYFLFIVKRRIRCSSDIGRNLIEDNTSSNESKKLLGNISRLMARNSKYYEFSINTRVECIRNLLQTMKFVDLMNVRFSRYIPEPE